MKKSLFGAALLASALGSALNADAAVYGYSTSSPTGVYEVLPEGLEIKFADSGYAGRMYVPMLSGWILDGKFYGYAPDIYGTRVYDNFFLEFDWESGELLSTKSISTAAALQYAALNPSDGYIYGFGVSNGNKCFMKAFSGSPEEITEICQVADDAYCTGLAYSSKENSIVGVKADGSIVRISPDGSQEVIVATGITPAPSTYSALAYNDEEGLYYWNFMNSDYSYVLYTVDPVSKTVTQETAFPERQCKFLFTENVVVSADAPAAPELLSLNFVNGATDGAAVVKMPVKTVSDEDILVSLHWFAAVDGTVVAEGDAEAGAQVSVGFKDVAVGQHQFSFYAMAGDERGKSVDTSVYVGVDTPVKPSNVVLSATQVSWDAVTEGVHGGYVSAQDMSYTVYINGQPIGSTAALSMPLPETADTSLRRIIATVTATSAGFTSEEAVSNPLVIGDAMSLPMELAPTADDFAISSIVDTNEDGRVWSFDEREGAFFSGYSDFQKLDDWLVLPPVNLSANVVYYFSMQARRKLNFFDQESLEVCVGNAPTAEAMAGGVLIKSFRPEASYGEYSGTIEVPSDGKYYIALHCTSEIGQSGVFVKEISLKDKGVTANSPLAVSELVATAAADGVLEATVGFKFPELTLSGAAIDPAAEMHAVVVAATETKVSGHAGEFAEVKVATVQGNNRISVQSFVGEFGSEIASVEVYTGVVVPGAVSSLKAFPAENMMSANLTWEAPTLGLDGGFIRPDELTYSVYKKTSTLLGDTWELLAGGLAECSYEFETETAEQDCYELAVTASNVAGECAEYSSTLAVLGTPHKLPMSDTFDSKEIYTYSPWVIYIPTEEYNTMWGPLPKSVLTFLYDDTDGNAICGMGLSEGCLGKAGFPVFSTKGCGSATLSATFWTGDGCSSDISITAITYGMTEAMEIGRVESNGDWNTLDFALPAELLDKEWVNLFIEASFPNGSTEWVVLDSYSVDMTTGVDDIVGDSYMIAVSGGKLSLTAPAATDYTVVDTLGRIVAAGKTDAAGSASIAPAAGIYIVRLGDITRKVTVK